MSRPLDHEKLEVYQTSLAVADPLDRASTSIPLNMAEGNGKFTGADRCRCFDNARGSALKCAAALDVWVAKGRFSRQDVMAGNDKLWSIVLMQVALIQANSSYRLRDRTFGGESD